MTDTKTADRFVDALADLETTHDPTPLVQLFADHAVLERGPRRTTYRGRDGAERFWAEYLDAFSRLETRFQHQLDADGTVVLEWQSSGALRDGAPCHYTGCSILETDAEGRITAFRTYYDASAFHG